MNDRVLSEEKVEYFIEKFAQDDDRCIADCAQDIRYDWGKVKIDKIQEISIELNALEAF